MTAPRIDTIRRELNDAQALLRYMAENLDDLHDIAYSKRRAPQTDRVRGGDPTAVGIDLSSDGHPKARDLYDDTAKAALKIVEDVVRLQREVRGFLTAHDEDNRTSKTLAANTSADDLIDAIASRRRRAARGEYEPHPIAKQPTVVPSIDWRTECEALRAAVRKVTTEFAQDHQHCQPPDEGIARYKRKLLRRYPTKNLSLRERDAWRNAQSVAVPSDAAAS